MNPDICYSAVSSRDPRFDGRFFTGVKTTGVYCRPICPAQTPRRRNCEFFPCAAAAEEAGYRPCLRCRPEASPGTPAWSGTSATVSRALRLIEEGALDDGNVEDLAPRLGVGSRHLRRLFNEHLGASPKAVAQTRRVHLAKKLIDETSLPMTEIAFSAGFSSVRRFNGAVKQTYGRSPSSLRCLSPKGISVPEHGRLTLRLAFRPPFSWRSIVDYMKPRAIPGVEEVDYAKYRRTFSVDGVFGILEIAPAAKGSSLILRVPIDACRMLKGIVERVRGLFDLGADPKEINQRLSRDPLLRKRVRRNPGIRVPGAFDRFELAVRALLGQQISVLGATTISGRIVGSFGSSMPGRAEGKIGRLFPDPNDLADADVESVGLTRARGSAVRNLARAVRDGDLSLETCGDLDAIVAGLSRIPGIGPWTAHYIAMRAFKEPDAFPAGDLGLRRALSEGGKPLSEARLAKRAEAWRPWRAYGAMHLWM